VTGEEDAFSGVSAGKGVQVWRVQVKKAYGLSSS